VTVTLFFRYPAKYGISETIDKVDQYFETDGILTVQAGNDNLSFHSDSIFYIEVTYSNGFTYSVY
jgi:hypothetical protein